jgi:hypothetical protein
MANQYNQYPRLHYSYSFQTLSYLITFIILLQGPIIIVAQQNQVSYYYSFPFFSLSPDSPNNEHAICARNIA